MYSDLVQLVFTSPLNQRSPVESRDASEACLDQQELGAFHDLNDFEVSLLRFPFAVNERCASSLLKCPSVTIGGQRCALGHAPIVVAVHARNRSGPARAREGAVANCGPRTLVSV